MVGGWVLLSLRAMMEVVLLRDVAAEELLYENWERMKGDGRSNMKLVNLSRYWL
jgi:hypothetical protein